MNELLTITEQKMEKTIASLDREYKSIRAGRANASVLDKVTVDYYGVPTPIQQMAAISIPEPRSLVIQPWDASTLKEIEKAILISEIGINPQNDGKVIRLSFPPLTEERRKDIVKDIKKIAEDAKVAIRNLRRDALDKLKSLKKNNEITEDDESNGEKKIQNLTDKFCKEIDGLCSDKENEIMEI
ncbi:MAG: ribosome recycling factor [Clostridia bacterium]|nr:ribosome recycling factor [Clostridia bacterium]